MMIMVEQVVYMLAAMCELQNVDFIIQEDDEDDIEEEITSELINSYFTKENIEIPEEITKQLEEADIPERRSLLGEQ